LKYLAIWLPLIISGSRELSSQETKPVILTNHDIIDYCSGEDSKKCVISLSVGNVEKSDSLLSFQALIRIDTTKLKLMSALYTNTLSEFFGNDYRGVNSLGAGYITLYGMALGMTPVWGNRPLIAFQAKYIGDCPDTSNVVFYNEYKGDFDIEISEDFKNKIPKQNVHLIIDARVVDKSDREVKAILNIDSVGFLKKDSTEYLVKVKLNTNNLTGISNISFLLNSSNKEQFEIIDIDSLSNGLSSKFKIEEITKSDSGYLIKTIINDNINDDVWGFKIKKLANKTDTGRIELKIVDINKCACVSRTKGSRTFIKSIKDTTGTNLVEDEGPGELKVYYNWKEEFIVVNSSRSDLKAIRLCNLNGSLIKSKSSDLPESYIRIEKEDLLNGYYIANIKLYNGLERNIVLIIN
jgi:hypothetical protein